MVVDPESNKLFSKWEREELRKPNVRKEGEEEEEEEEEEEGVYKLPSEHLLIHQEEDSLEKLQSQMKIYSDQRSLLEDLMMPLYNNQYLKVDVVGLTP